MCLKDGFGATQDLYVIGRKKIKMNETVDLTFSLSLNTTNKK